MWSSNSPWKSKLPYQICGYFCKLGLVNCFEKKCKNVSQWEGLTSGTNLSWAVADFYSLEIFRLMTEHVFARPNLLEPRTNLVVVGG